MSIPFNLTASWLAPAFSQLNLTNCSTLTPFLADLMLNVAHHNISNMTMISEDFTTVIRFLDAAVPNDWPHQYSASELVQWYLDIWSNPTYQSTPQFTMMWYGLENTAYGACNAELCNSLQIKGDPDVSGRGMMGAYYISAILSTIYFFVLIIDRLSSSHKIPSRILDAFRESTNTFLDEALIFAVAMLASTVVRYASVTHSDDNFDNYSAYRLLGSVFMSTFAIFPCLLLQSVAGGLRRRFLRQGLWTVVVGLKVVVIIQMNTVYIQRFVYDMSNPNDAQLESVPGFFREYLWSRYCDNNPLVARTLIVEYTGALLGLLNLLWLVYYVLTSLPSVGRSVASVLERSGALGMRRNGHAARWERMWRYLLLLNGIACSIVMWLLLVFFTSWSIHVQNKAPSTDEDTKWTFGQVLSLATWVPVFIEWLAILVAGPEEGLGQRLSTSYEVTKVTATDEARRMNQGPSSDNSHGSLAPSYSFVTEHADQKTKL
ncbi:hypothetical protein F4810DRAFT_200615 [Camillea tinctor]|nr:hypothetical protein F4810DRAFT_200615 [Camillea tinctor]